MHILMPSETANAIIFLISVPQALLQDHRIENHHWLPLLCLLVPWMISALFWALVWGQLLLNHCLISLSSLSLGLPLPGYACLVYPVGDLPNCPPPPIWGRPGMARLKSKLSEYIVVYMCDKFEEFLKLCRYVKSIKISSFVKNLSFI